MAQRVKVFAIPAPTKLHLPEPVWKPGVLACIYIPTSQQRCEAETGEWPEAYGLASLVSAIEETIKCLSSIQKGQGFNTSTVKTGLQTTIILRKWK